jgi:RNA polymerase sigma-70 factor (ECF subfamily)
MLSLAMAARSDFSPVATSVATGEVVAVDRLGQVAELYDRHHDAVRSFARRLVGDEAAAEDLVQDTFLCAPRALARYRGEASLRTLLFSIAVNLAKKHVRSAARRRAAQERAALEPVMAATPTPEDDLARKQVALVLHRALDALPLEQRVAFVLLEIEELPSAEAASVAGVPEPTMRTRLFHAKRRLREILRRRGIA